MSEKEELLRKIAVMQHFADGGQIEVLRQDQVWHLTDLPQWCWVVNDYRIKPVSWRPATLDDVLLAIRGLAIKARMRVIDEHPWTNDCLIGYWKAANGTVRYVGETGFYKFCEVKE